MTTPNNTRRRLYRIELGDTERAVDVHTITAKGFGDAYEYAKQQKKSMNFREIVSVTYLGEFYDRT